MICLDMDIIFVASLPIRNWNISSDRCIGCKNTCCEPTYKELKLELNPKTYLYLPSCEPTYKELKHFWHSRRASLKRGCEPTYKELKLDYFIPGSKFFYSCEPTYKELKLCIYSNLRRNNCSVASLPIRNWNTDWTHDDECVSVVASLPIRNWNFLMMIGCLRGKGLRAYL